MQTRYEIYAVLFPKTGKNTIHGVHPAVLLRRKTQKALEIVTAVPISSNQQLTQDVSRIKVGDSPENGLRELSVLLPEQITTVDESRIGQKIGALTNEQARYLRISLVG